MGRRREGIEASLSTIGEAAVSSRSVALLLLMAPDSAGFLVSEKFAGFAPLLQMGAHGLLFNPNRMPFVELLAGPHCVWSRFRYLSGYY